MASNIVEVVKGLLRESSLKESELAELEGVSPQNMHNKLSSRRHSDMPVGNAARYLGHLGFQVVVVPRGKRLPEGSIVVEYVDRK